MTDHFSSDSSADDQIADPVVMRLLGDPMTWDPVSDADADAIAAAIGDLVSAPEPAPTVGPVSHAEAVGAPVTSISSSRRLLVPVLAGVAAAVVVFVGLSLAGSSGPQSDSDLALAATELSPGAFGAVEIFDTANGTRILLDVSGLPPAPEGQYYEAWLRQDAAVGVSAGTFHLRGGGGEIELWAGVVIDDYPLFTITIQDEADTESSGRVVLKGLLDDADS